MPKLKGTNYYYSSVRMGLVNRAQVAPGGAAPVLDIAIETSANLKNASSSEKRTAKLKVGLYGPGDVLGFDSQKAVSKIQPQDNSTHFNPDQFPFIEFSEADFLWRFSVDRGNGTKDWQPWLTLIILKRKDGAESGEFSFVRNSDPHLPARIQIKAGVPLPNLSQAWRWAHVHYIGAEGMDRETIEGRLYANPRHAICRLLAARRLEEGVSYTAFVVPTYRLGWLAAMGDTFPTEVDATQKSWTGKSLTGNTEIPYYYSWDFRCGSQGGFEDLAKSITPTKINTQESQYFSTQEIGYQVSDVAEKYRFLTALEPLGTEHEKTASPQMAELLNQGEEVRSVAEHELDRKVVPPIYGRWYVARPSQRLALQASKADKHWLEELNIDPRLRLIAGLGAEVIKQNQDDLLAEAWQQYSVIDEENRRLKLGRFGTAVAACLYKRIKEVKNETQLLQITSPMHGDIGTPSSSSTTGSSVASHLEESAAPTVLFQGKMRQFAKKLKRREGVEAVLNTNSIVHPVFMMSGIEFDSTTAAVFTVDTPPELAAEEAAVKAGLDPTDTIAQPISQHVAPLRQWTLEKKNQQEAGGQSSPELEASNSLQPIKWYPQFHQSVYEHLLAVSPGFLLPGIANMPPDSVAVCQVNQTFVEAYLLGMNHELAAELRWREFPTDMRGSYFRKFWDATVYAVDEAERTLFQETIFGLRLLQKLLLIYPDVFTDTQPDKVWESLRKITEKGEPSPLELDILEMREEAIENWLLTREEDKDVLPLHQWLPDTPLGTHTKGKTTSGEQIVLLMRARLFKKFPNLLIYLAPIKESKPDYREAQRKYPIFEGQLPPDISFVGFASVDAAIYYIVFEERISEQRYGLDAGVDNKLTGSDGSDLDDLAWSHFSVAVGKYLDDLQPDHLVAAAEWDNAAFIAKATTQRPVRFALPLTQFIN